MAGVTPLKIEINAFEAQEMAGYFSDGGGRGYSTRVTIATARAINRALAHMQTLVIKDIRAAYNVKRADVAAVMKLKKATAKKIMQGSLEFEGRASLSLIRFGGRRNKHGVSVRVLKTSRAGNIQPGGTHKILATKKAGRAAVWIAKGVIMARTEEAEHPIMLWGPSFLAYFHRPGIAEQLRERAAAKFRERLKHEVAWALENQTSGHGRNGKAGQK
ncbi:MAG: phage tail protein [Deltaproteobacteria bacterium]|jgi:hypothetical protein|nr:phage tail protein [Deltaproteobacteria bacterium]